MKSSNGIRANESSLDSPYFNKLSAQQCENLHNASLEILERTGVRLFDPEAVELLRNAGAFISEENRVLEVDEPFITIEGTAHRIATLSMNGETIPVTEDGAFSEPYLLAPGYNRIVLTASDRYNKSTERIIEIVYTPAVTSTSSPIAPQE